MKRTGITSSETNFGIPPKPMCFHELTERVAKREGLKTSVNIAQIKEITKILLNELSKLTPEELKKLLK